MLILVVVSVLWVPVVQNSQNGKLFDYIQQISAYLAPSIAAVYTGNSSFQLTQIDIQD